MADRKKQPAAGKRKQMGTRPARPTTRLTHANPLQVVQRGRIIIEMRTRMPRPAPWKQVAAAVGVSETYAQELYRKAVEWEEPLYNPLDALEETIGSLTAAMHAAWETYEEAEKGSSTRVRALKAAAEITMQRLDLLQRAGRAPRSLSAPSAVAEMRAVFTEFAQLLERYDVPDQALTDLITMAEQRMNGGSTPPALPAGPG